MQVIFIFSRADKSGGFRRFKILDLTLLDFINIQTFQNDISDHKAKLLRIFAMKLTAGCNAESLFHTIYMNFCFFSPIYCGIEVTFGIFIGYIINTNNRIQEEHRYEKNYLQR